MSREADEDVIYNGDQDGWARLKAELPCDDIVSRPCGMTLVGTCGPTIRAAKRKYLSRQHHGFASLLASQRPSAQAFYSDMFGKSNISYYGRHAPTLSALARSCVNKKTTRGDCQHHLCVGPQDLWPC